MSHDPAKPFTASQVRRDFLDFFVERRHTEVPSGPVFPQDDPTLLFTNAGMNQFKDVFLGMGTRDYKRAVDTQKCIRASGKHNDLEDVGRDSYHHTFFEMLGNWSFGDYFKKEAIVWAWQLLTEVWDLPRERLWVTVFAGDEKDGLGVDEEAESIWLEHTNIDPSHVLRFDRRDNFWEMGETGPCGPCSEIHIDRGEGGADSLDGANPEIGVNAGNERFIELWNLVFMQFNRMDSGQLVDLPAPCVDTGMGFERILAVLQEKSSNYDTDLFQPIFRRLAEISGKAYQTGSEEDDVAFRVCADHVRAVACAFADGALPSNEGRGYVLRRLIRRASRFGRQALDVQDPFLFELVPVVADVLGDAFPEVRQRIDHIQLLVKSEEEAFGKTLDRGLVLFDQLAQKIEAGGERTLSRAEAYELYATYGFPRDLVELMARERGLAVDLAGWETAQKTHREISKSEGKFKQLLSADELAGLGATRSTYHEDGEPGHRLEATMQLCVAREAGRVVVVIEASPFYPEGGGQVGDRGTLEALDGSFRIAIEETKRIGTVVVHSGHVTAGEPMTAVGNRVRATVDREARERTRKNHTATHLMHRALRDVLGEHVTQQGSYVGPDRLRFDLSHPKGLTPEEIEEIERRVNEQIAANAPVATTLEELEAAKARGVMALFGEKYDAKVRVVDVGGWSTELCGGTHVRAAGDIGPFVIVQERAIQAGVRRIEALTGADSVLAIQHQRRLVQQAAQALKVKADEVPDRIDALQKQLKDAKKQQKASSGADLTATFQTVKAGLAERGGALTGVIDCPPLDGKSLRDLGDRLKSLSPDLAVAVFGRDDGKVPYLVICQGVAQAKGLQAGTLVKGLRDVLGGGGGGRPDVAQGQGTDPAGIPAAVERLESAMASALGD